MYHSFLLVGQQEGILFNYSSIFMRSCLLNAFLGGRIERKIGLLVLALGGRSSG